MALAGDSKVAASQVQRRTYLVLVIQAIYAILDGFRWFSQDVGQNKLTTDAIAHNIDPPVALRIQSLLFYDTPLCIFAFFYSIKVLSYLRH